MWTFNLLSVFSAERKGFAFCELLMQTEFDEELNDHYALLAVLEDDYFYWFSLLGFSFCILK